MSTRIRYCHYLMDPFFRVVLEKGYAVLKATILAIVSLIAFPENTGFTCGTTKLQLEISRLLAPEWCAPSRLLLGGPIEQGKSAGSPPETWFCFLFCTWSITPLGCSMPFAARALFWPCRQHMATPAVFFYELVDGGSVG
jgi:hypothetical protein